MTARRKQEAVLRVLRGEPLEVVARELRRLDSASLSLAAAEIAAMDREFLYFGHNAMTA